MKVTLHMDINVDPLGLEADRVREIIDAWTYTLTEFKDVRTRQVVAVDEVDVQKLTVEED